MQPSQPARVAIQRAQVDGSRAWMLATRRTAVLLRLGADDALSLPYWGANGGAGLLDETLAGLPRSRDAEAGYLDGQPLAYPVYGSPTFKEPCLVISRAPGVRGPRLRFPEDRPTPAPPDLGFRRARLGLL